jgi:hypothetical protein
MDIFIYFNERLPVGLDELEDALDAALGDEGEVTGTGAGECGSNLDLFVKNEAMTDGEVVGLVRKALTVFAIPKASKIVIDDKEFSIV